MNCKVITRTFAHIWLKQQIKFLEMEIKIAS